MTDLPQQGSLIRHSVAEAFALYGEMLQMAGARSATEPERYHVDMILQVVWAC
jgi:hypothetical protein